MPTLGVGVVYWPQLDPLLTDAAGLVDVLEIEPQAYWYEQHGPGGPLRCDSRIIDRLLSLPQHKIVHSVGCPVGGSFPAADGELTLLSSIVEALDARWITEHLSFRAYPRTPAELSVDQANDRCRKAT